MSWLGCPIPFRLRRGHVEFSEPTEPKNRNKREEEPGGEPRVKMAGGQVRREGVARGPGCVAALVLSVAGQAECGAG